MRIVDLSLPIDEKAFEVHHVDIERVTHKAGVEKFNRVIMGKTLKGKIGYLFGKRILKPTDVPDEEFLSLEIVHSPVGAIRIKPRNSVLYHSINFYNNTSHIRPYDIVYPDCLPFNPDGQAFTRLACLSESFEILSKRGK